MEENGISHECTIQEGRNRNVTEDESPAGSEDGGASALFGDADPRSLREQTIGCRKYMEELFRLAKKEYEQDVN
jgi:hypothetical protein